MFVLFLKDQTHSSSSTDVDGSGHEMDKLQRRLAYLYKPPVQGKFTILLLLLFGFVMTVDYVY